MQFFVLFGSTWEFEDGFTFERSKRSQPSYGLVISIRHASTCRLVSAVALILVTNLRPVGKRVMRSIFLTALRQYIEVAADPPELFPAATERADSTRSCDSSAAKTGWSIDAVQIANFGS